MSRARSKRYQTATRQPHVILHNHTTPIGVTRSSSLSCRYVKVITTPNGVMLNADQRGHDRFVILEFVQPAAARAQLAGGLWAAQ